MKRGLLVFALFFTVCRTQAGEVKNGGNLIDGDPVSQSEILDFLKFARRYVYGHLLWQTQQAQKKGENFAKLFVTQPSIFTQIESFKLDIKLDKPCKDEAGKDADGSSVGDPTQEGAGTVCLSVFRLQNKLKKNEYNLEDYKFQILALLAHEYSHRVGFDEVSAELIQTDVLKALRAAYIEKKYILYDSFWFEVISPTQLKHNILSFNGRKSLNELQRISFYSFPRLISRSGEFPFDSFSETENAKYVIVDILTYTVTMAINSLVPRERMWVDSEIYLKIFGSEEKMTAYDFVIKSRFFNWHKLMSKYPTTADQLKKIQFVKFTKQNFEVEAKKMYNLALPLIEDMITLGTYRNSALVQ